MSKELKCALCSLDLGEMEKGKLRRNSVLLCGACWERLTYLGNTNKDTPDFLKNLFGMFDKGGSK